MLHLFTCHPGHYASNIICYSEKVSHCGSVQQLVLLRKERFHWKR